MPPRLGYIQAGVETVPKFQRLLGRAHTQRRLLRLPLERKMLNSLLGLPETKAYAQKIEKLSWGWMYPTVGVAEPWQLMVGKSFHHVP